MELLIRDNVLYEAILTACYNGPYVAPVGFVKRGDTVEIRVYKGGKLLEVVGSCDTIALNVVHEPSTFIMATLKRISPFDPNRDFMYIGELPILAKSIGYLVLSKLNITDYGEYVTAKYTIQEIKVNAKAVIEPYSRCYGSLIELLIYATKVKGVKDREAKLRYANKAEELFEVISKTCSGEYTDIANTLRVLIAKWLGG